MTDLFKAYWTDDIHDEWINALLRSGKHSRETLQRIRELMDLHVRDPKVFGYETLIAGLELPDPATVMCLPLPSSAMQTPSSPST